MWPPSEPQRRAQLGLGPERTPQRQRPPSTWAGLAWGRIGRHPLDSGYLATDFSVSASNSTRSPMESPMASIVPAANSNTKRAGFRDRAARPQPNFVGRLRSSAPRGGSASFGQDPRPGFDHPQNIVEVDEAVFHPKTRTDRWGKAKIMPSLSGGLEPAEASFTRGRIAGQSHGKGSFSNSEGDGLLGHRRSATGQESDQTPQREDQFQRIPLSRVGGHRSGCPLVMVS